MTTARSRSKAYPSILGWTFAAVSLVLALAIGTFGVAYRIDRDTDRSFEQLSSSLARGKLTEARFALETWNSGASLPNSFFGGSGTALRARAIGIARDLTVLAEQATSRKLTPLDVTLERANRSVLSLSEEYRDVVTAWERVRVAVEEQRDDTRRLMTMMERRRELTAFMSSAVQQYEQLSARFASLLGLRREQHRDGAEIAFPAYSHGVFTGLPTLSRLPDGLESLVDAKLILDQIGGQVGVSGPTAMEDFTAELESIRALMGPVISKREEFQNETSALDQEETDTIQRREQRDPRLTTLLTPIILRLASPPPSWSALLFKTEKGA
jgi:hypothetical protein